MTGAALTFTFDDADVREALSKLRALAAEPEPLLAAMGFGLARNVRDRFRGEHDPDGNPWAPLMPAYEAEKTGPGILREKGMSGGLMGSITSEVEAGEVTVGSNKVYAAVHQFGATIKPKDAPALIFRIGDRLVWARQVTIPARPYLGFGHDDETMLVEVAEDYMAHALGGPVPAAASWGANGE
jgi:phage virion morphogenesis protein